ncbi:hypothetical protein F5B17DRAFT_301006 [Nemania serpens]|nr:hypothetical protein F5B17DRAFT_301006 [Nemania serpens]
MPQWKLHHVRTDDKHVVFTEYPDLIHPRELSAWLQGQYGRPNIHIYLVKDIYVIYIKRDAVNEDGEVTPHPTTDCTDTPRTSEASTTPDWQQVLSDIEEAQGILEKYRLANRA